MNPDIGLLRRFQPRLERPGEQNALLRGIVLTSGTDFTAWAVTPWEEWIGLGTYPAPSDAWRRVHEIDDQFVAWRQRESPPFDERDTTPLIWLALEWAAIDLDAFNTLWGVPPVF